MSELDPIELQLALGALHAACGEMGALLIRAAHSPNIKERRDASSALFNHTIPTEPPTKITPSKAARLCGSFVPAPYRWLSTFEK